MDAHDTPVKALCAVPGGVGVRCTVQVLPFQRSASGLMSVS